VEAALAAAEQNNLRPLERLLDVLATPFDHTRPTSDYHQPAPDNGRVYQTFCGT